MGRILRSLEPFILSGEPIVELPAESVKGSARAVKLSDGQGHSRVLVIGLDYDNEVRITLPADCAGLTSRFGFTTRQADGKFLYRAGLRSCDLLQ